MIALAMVAVMAANAPRFTTRECSRMPGGRSTRGIPCEPVPFFELAPVSGLGLGSACACANVAGDRGEVVTWTRASAGECYSTDAQTLTQCASGLPRVMAGNVTQPQLGVLVETTKTNDLLWSRDLSNAAWVKTSMTCTLTATGMRNDVNGASLCTATAGLGTVLQTTITSTTTRNFTGHIKRITGTGTIEVTIDGATWLDITASVTSAWKRFGVRETLGCAGGNCIVVAGLSNALATRITGIRLTTSGDAVAVDFTQLETGLVSSTPIETTTAAATRATDSATVVVPGLAALAASGCARAVVQNGAASGHTGSLLEGDAVTGRYLFLNTTLGASDGTNTPTLAATTTFGLPNTYRSTWGAGAITIFNETAVTSTSSAFTGAMGTTGPLSITGGNYVLKSLTLDPNPARCTP